MRGPFAEINTYMLNENKTKLKKKQFRTKEKQREMEEMENIIIFECYLFFLKIEILQHCL